MSEILKPCPFCGAMPIGHDDRYMCSTPGCVMQEDTISAENWNTRPIEDAMQKRIAELEEAQRWIPVSERLPEVNGWYLCGMVSFLGTTFTNEIYFDAVNIDPRWNNPTQDRVYCWLDGIPELPEVTE